MIGPKKLCTIREELRRALNATGEDPIRWLEERMASPACERAVASGESEVLQSLRRVLEAAGKGKRRKQRFDKEK